MLIEYKYFVNETFTFFYSSLIHIFLAIFIYNVSSLYETNIFLNVPITFVAIVVENYSLIYYIDTRTFNAKNFSENMILPKEEFNYEFHLNCLTHLSIETLTFIFIKRTIIRNKSLSLNNFLIFIPMSFIFEIIYDFFFYIMHRLFHTNKYLYKFHKKHHKFYDVTSIITFYHHPIDIICSGAIPFILTTLIIDNISLFNFTLFNFTLLLIYKDKGEIAGHLGKKIYPMTSFSQFKWLALLFDIQSYAEDHYLHHQLINCNFSKRFSLWDKLFGTYKSPFKKIEQN